VKAERNMDKKRIEKGREALPYNIVLIGFMGTGKSTIARKLARQYDMKVVEMDQELEKREQMRIPEIFEKKGENYFRDAETRFLKEILTGTGQVISCGGGVVLREENRKELKRNGNGRVVLLTATPETILKRTRNSHHRPLLEKNKSIEAIQEMMEQRREKYESAADMMVATDDKTAEKICREIMEIFD
jgi:shikimate kinase